MPFHGSSVEINLIKMISVTFEFVVVFVHFNLSREHEGNVTLLTGLKVSCGLEVNGACSSFWVLIYKTNYNAPVCCLVLKWKKKKTKTRILSCKVSQNNQMQVICSIISALHRFERALLLNRCYVFMLINPPLNCKWFSSFWEMNICQMYWWSGKGGGTARDQGIDCSLPNLLFN